MTAASTDGFAVDTEEFLLAALGALAGGAAFLGVRLAAAPLALARAAR